jgi:hypothetical protein
MSVCKLEGHTIWEIIYKSHVIMWNEGENCGQKEGFMKQTKWIPDKCNQRKIDEVLFERLTLDLDFTLLQNEIRAGNTLPDVLNVFDDGFEVGSSVVGASDEYVVLLAGARGGVEGTNGDKLVVDGAQEAQTGADLKLWLVGFDNGTDDCDIYVLGADVVGRRDHGNVDIWSMH